MYHNTHKSNGSSNQEWAIDIRNVSKSYGDVFALKDVSLQIGNNEFFTLLGPSGCGKTTMLRIIAGFEEADCGSIFLFGGEIEKLPPHKRPINTVFQNYALFPHMTALDNIKFGLRMLQVPEKDVTQRAAAMLEITQLSEFAARRPGQLSGGQQQRVALARALAPSPKVLLLDESLSALDLKLRQTMRVELKQIQRETGITFIFVTHDQDEALTMSDRIAVMSQGTLQQVGKAREIYESPINRFVADFIGEVNLLPATIEKTATQTFCVLAGGHRIEIANTITKNNTCHISIRPEKARLVTKGGMRGIIERNIYIGAITETHVRLINGPIFSVRTQNTSSDSDNENLREGREVGVLVESTAARILQE